MRKTVSARGLPIQIAKRRNGGIQITQGRSYIMLSRGEVLDLITAMEKIHAQACPDGQE